VGQDDHPRVPAAAAAAAAAVSSTGGSSGSGSSGGSAGGKDRRDKDKKGAAVELLDLPAVLSPGATPLDARCVDGRVRGCVVDSLDSPGRASDFTRRVDQSIPRRSPTDVPQDVNLDFRVFLTELCLLKSCVMEEGMIPPLRRKHIAAIEGF